MFFLPSTQGVTFDNPRFISFEDRSHDLNAVELRTIGSVPGLEAQVRRTLADVNPNLAIIDYRSFAAQVDNNFSQQKMIAKLTSLFGLIALALASVGIYGVTAYSVERRTNEIGVRMALGAQRIAILRLIFWGALLQLGLALAIGIPVTIIGGHAMAAKLFGVKPYDPRILLLSTVGLFIATFLAALIPARRAATLDPMCALRTE
jgi:ABC-type antimicrobial peptide transport system permease subunit